MFTPEPTVLISDRIQANLIRRKGGEAAKFPSKPESICERWDSPKRTHFSPIHRRRSLLSRLALLNDKFWDLAERFGGSLWKSLCTDGYGVYKGSVQGVFELFVFSFILLPVVIVFFLLMGPPPSFLLPAITGLAIWANQRKK
jgi:hypothetical protein